MITLNNLKNLKKGQTIQIQHPLMEQVSLTIQHDFIIDYFFNMPTTLYSDQFIVIDNHNRIRPKHKLVLSKREVIDYISELFKADSIYKFNYIRNLKERNLSIGSIIEFTNKSQGVICEPYDEYNAYNLRYIPLKKDGTISKMKPRYLYGNATYKEVGKYKF